MWGLFHYRQSDQRRVRFSGDDTLSEQAAVARAHDVNIGKGRGSWHRDGWTVKAFPLDSKQPE